MALFSRRGKRTGPSEPAGLTPADADPAEPDEAADPAEPDEAAEPPAADDAGEAVPAVGISVSSFRSASAVAASEPVDEAIAAASVPDAVPGIRDNALLRDALATLADDPEPAQILSVARQLLQNHLFLRVKGDARALLSEGKDLPLAVLSSDDGQYVMAYSSGAALQRSLAEDGDTDTSAMGQPVMAVLGHVLAGGYAGVVLDPSSAPARLVLPRELLERMTQQADPALTLKTLLADPRTDSTPGEVARAMAQAPVLFVAVGSAGTDEAGEAQLGIAESRDPEGRRILELYTHPLEVVAMGRGDQAAPLTPQQVGEMLRGHEDIAGIVLDPGGPWIRLGRDELGPVIALAGQR